MRILLDGPSGTPLLDEPDDFTSFAVTASGPPDAERLAVAAAWVGRADAATHVYVERSALIRLAGDRGRDVDWLENLRKMMAYARDHGWVDDRGAVRAHVEWRDARPSG